MKTFTKMKEGIIIDRNEMIIILDEEIPEKEKIDKLISQIPEGTRRITIKTDCYDLLDLCSALDGPWEIVVESHIPFTQHMLRVPAGNMFSLAFNYINYYVELVPLPHAVFDVPASISKERPIMIAQIPPIP